ncbi:MAG: hypothetical protein U1F54_00005, partial [Burkholderiales bacterium]
VVALFTLATAVLSAWFPRILAWPVAVLCGWLGLSWAWKAWTLWRRGPASGRNVERGERPSKAAAGGKDRNAAIIDSSRP